MATPFGGRVRKGAWLLLPAAFWPTLLAFPGTWASSYQEHGFFVAALVAWLIVRDRRAVAERAERPIAALAWVLAPLSLAWMGAVIMNVRLVHEGLFVVLMTLWGLAVYGWGARTVVLGIGLTALLAVPFWAIGVPILQRATVLASGGATRLLGIEAQIGGDAITLGSGTFLIEEGCAGLNYLMAGLVLGAAYGHLFAARWQTILKIVALFGAVAIVGNWIRVAALIVLGELTAMQSPYIEDHLWQGWLIFTVLMAPTFLLAGRVERRDRARSHLTTRGAGAPSHDPGPAAGPAAERGRRLATAVTVIGPAFFTALSLVPRGTDLDRDLSPLGVAPSWSASEVTGGVAWAPQFAGIDEVRSWRLRSGASEVEAARHYFIAQRQGEELIQYDNRIAPDSAVLGARLVGPVGPSRRFVNETLFMDAETPRLVWHWYRVAGIDTNSKIRAKLLEVPGFMLRYPASELVTLTATCAPNDCSAASRALASSLGTTG